MSHLIALGLLLLFCADVAKTIHRISSMRYRMSLVTIDLFCRIHILNVQPANLGFHEFREGEKGRKKKSKKILEIFFIEVFLFCSTRRSVNIFRVFIFWFMRLN